ncbi:MAG TPA: hypothetical protein VGI82_08035 [Chitinophagaceae bacterium]|jgi:hypothetical protein
MNAIPVFFDNVKRTAIVINPKNPFYDWLKSIDPNDTSAMDANSDVYLLRDFETESEMESWLKRNFDLIFSDQLNNWYVDEKLWVTNRTFKMFKEWFDYSLHTMIWDTVQGDIAKA